MNIEGKQKITHPAKLAFETIRDKCPELVPFMPNIESVETLSREEKPPIVNLHNRWQGTNDDVPRLIRPFISKDLVAWEDKAIWNEKTLVCEWTIEPIRAKGVFTAKGTSTISDLGNGECMFIFDSIMEVHPEKVPGIPKFLAKKVREPIEQFIGNSLRTNATGIALAVQKYLDSKK